MIIKFTNKFNSSDILTEDALERIKNNNPLKFEEPMSCKCKCQSGETFSASVTDEGDVEFYQNHFGAGGNIEFECESNFINK